MIDWDCDGYGPGSPNGPDADDNDASVNTAASAVAKYGSTAGLLAHLGYNPQRLLFISTSGNDSTGQPNSETQPFRSWSGLTSRYQISPGDAVIWRAGTYPDAPSLYGGGSAGSPIMLMAYPGERVTLDNALGNGIAFVGQSYITLDGLGVTNSTGSGGEGVFFGQPAAGITIRNMEIYNRGRGILGMNGLNTILIEHNVIHDTTLEHDIYLGSREMPSSNVTVQNNILYNAAYNGFQFNGRVSNMVVDSNIIHDNGLSALSFIQGVSNSTIKNNLMFNNARNCMIMFDYVDPNPIIAPYDQTNNLFVNNTCWVGLTDRTGATVSQPGINIDSQGLNVSLDNNRFENNIFVTQNYATFRFGQAKYLNTTTIKNNVMLNASGTAYLNYAGADYPFSSLNSWDSLKGGNVQGDPMFANVQTSLSNSPQSFDFTLRSGSPASKLSIAADAPSLDIKRVSRGSATDAGAYQCGGSASTVPALQINSSALAGGTAGTAYSQSLSASGGTSPYSWSIASGSLPGGLTLSSGGAIAGTPTASGTFTFTAKVTDSASRTATASFSIAIAAAPVVTPPPTAALQINSSALASGTAGTAYSQSLSASGGTSPYSWSIASGSLPGGLTLSSGGAIAGTPAASGTSTFTAKVTDSASRTATASFSIAIAAAPVTPPPVVTTPPSTPTPPVSSAKFQLNGVASEVTANTNGATVNPAAGFPGKLTVRGSGSVNFTSNGVAFKKGSQQNSDTAFYTFTGSQVGNVFNVNGGEINFDLTSSYNFADRLKLPQYNYREVLDVYDASGRELFVFQVQAVWGRLSLYYNMGGTAPQTYYLPAGTEDANFGAGKTVHIRMVWNGKTMSLYGNGNLLAQTPYTMITPNWGSGASFTIGANDPHVYTGGYFACDDVLANFLVK